MEYRSLLRKVLFYLSVLLLSVAAIDDALAQSWQYVAPMHFRRTELSAVALPDGRVLVAGGNDGSQVLSSCEIYDPKTNTWTMTGSMHEARYRFPMIMLQDGRIMAAGGLTDMGVSTSQNCELYNPSTGSWTQVSPMLDRRENFPLFQLPNGKVFICGGLDANIPVYLNSAEYYDPKTDSHTLLAPMNTAVFGPFVFQDTVQNRILVQGGSYNGLGGTYPPLLQEYDIATDNWIDGPNSNDSHDGGYNVQLPDQSIVVVGGRTGPYTSTDAIEVIRPPYTIWESVGSLTSKRWHGCGVLIGADSILAIGGDNDPGINVNIFDSTNWYFVREQQTTQGPRMLDSRANFGAVLSRQPITECASQLVVYVFGGASKKDGVVNTAESLDLGVRQDRIGGSASLHREIASSFFGHPDSLQLLLDVRPTLNIDSLWPTLHDVSATYAWDSSIVTFSDYMPPSGWSLRGLTVNGNSVDFTIHNVSSSPTTPLNLGTAIFMPNNVQLTASNVTLPSLSLKAGTQTISPCISDNEDQHWAVKVLGVEAVGQDGPTYTIGIDWVRASGDNLQVGIHGIHGPSSGTSRGDVALYDLLGRKICATEISADQPQASLDIHGLASGVYFVRLTVGSSVSSNRFVLSRE